MLPRVLSSGIRYFFGECSDQAPARRPPFVRVRRDGGHKRAGRTLWCDAVRGFDSKRKLRNTSVGLPTPVTSPYASRFHVLLFDAVLFLIGGCPAGGHLRCSARDESLLPCRPAFLPVTAPLPGSLRGYTRSALTILAPVFVSFGTI